MLLNSYSPKANIPNNINIKLKEHQLAMLQRCIDIENIENNLFGIMCDKPGTGKTYVILSLIYYFKFNQKEHQTNIIIVPQNIYTQWIISIEKFSNNLTYNKFINYENIMSLYLKPDILQNNDIILTTSSYYHIIATTLNSLNIRISRIFFDEIDSISNIISTKIDANFIWFVSASFNIDYLGYYGNKIKNYDIDIIKCQCDNDYIDENIYLETPIKKYYLCKNIYIDNILESVVTKKELRRLNAMNFTLNKKEFEQNKVNNEKEVINLIIKNRKSIIDFNKYKIEESNKNIEHYTKCFNNKLLYYENYKTLVDKLNEKNNLIIFKDYIIDFLSHFQDFILLPVFKDEFRQKGIQSLKIVFDDIIDICYNMNEIDRICTNHLNSKKITMEIDMIIMNIKKMNIIIGNILKTLNDIKEEDTVVYNLYDNLETNKNYFENLLNKINEYSDSILSPSQIEIHTKQLEISQKLIDENKNKIDLIYARLIENKCCPICYEQYENKSNCSSVCTSPLSKNKELFSETLTNNNQETDNNNQETDNNQIEEETDNNKIEEETDNNQIEEETDNNIQETVNNQIEEETDNNQIEEETYNNNQIEEEIGKKVYYTSNCCNNKICEYCITEWYKMNKESCIFCNTSNILLSDLIYCYIDENKIENSNYNKIDSTINNNLIEKMDIYFDIYNSSKGDFLDYYIKELTICDKKIIIFSDYSSVFQYIEMLCNKYNIKYVDLDKGNIKDIDNSVSEYKYGDAKILLSNSTLFGCGMNFENATDILFVHKMDKDMEKQVIGRAQRMGRKSVLNIIYLEYENESEFTIKINKNSNLNYTTYEEIDEETDDLDIHNELYKYYKNKQISNILDNIQEINFDDISNNEIIDTMETFIDTMETPIDTMETPIDTMETSIDKINDDIIPLSSDYIDINLEELISSLQ